MQCIACHTAYPVLNDLGREFKLRGYTLSADQSELPPVAAMFQPSFTHTEKSQTGGAAPGFKDNNNAALTQASLFYAGRLFGPFGEKLFGKDIGSFADKLGIFLQATYNGVAKTWSWDNTELRYADSGKIAGHDAVYGFYLNNNPTLQDPWNGTPAWGFPFTSSKLAPVPAASTLVGGGLSQQVGGLGAYAMFSNVLYLDIGGYRTLGSHFQRSVGISPTGETQIAGVAPYWRAAVVQSVGPGRWEFGTFGMAAHTYPGRDKSAGNDRIVDFGLDSQYQESIGRNDITLLLSYIYERQTWNAGQALGNTTNSTGVLRNFRGTVDYLYDKTYGAAAQYFSSDANPDALLYSGSRTESPDSDGIIFQINYLPFNKRGGPAFWPFSNVKYSLQYTMYNRFNGAKLNYDGLGSNARDNNTLYLEAWVAF